LYSDACLQTEVRAIRWQAGDQRWLISTDHGDTIRARFVAMANGYLQKPKLPGIPGITEFRGRADFARTREL
jgi:cation diffusion facilitator CzcD-associated flavoprotein CzcO